MCDVRPSAGGAGTTQQQAEGEAGWHKDGTWKVLRKVCAFRAAFLRMLRHAVLSAPVAAQVDAVHIDVWIVPALQRTVPPVLNVNISFLVQLTDGGRRDPQRLGDVLHPAHGDACQVHLDERLLHAALPAAIPLDDGRLEGHALEPGHMERDVSGGRGEIAVIVAAMVFIAAVIS